MQPKFQRSFINHLTKTFNYAFEPDLNKYLQTEET